MYAELLKQLLDRLRPEQIYAVGKIIEGIKASRKYIFVNAPTGFGKTVLGIASSLYGLARKMIPIIAVRTRSQISSFVRDCAKFLDRLPSIKLCKSEVCVRYRAKDSSLIPCRKCRLIKEPSEIEKLTDTYKRLLNKVKLAVSSPDAPSEATDPYILAREIAKWRTVCPYYLFSYMHRLSDLNIFVCTYPYLTRLRGKLFEELEKEFGEDVPKMLIVDEGHNLEDPIFWTYAVLTRQTIDGAKNEVRKYITENDQNLAELLLAVLDALDVLLTKLLKSSSTDEDIVELALVAEALQTVDRLENIYSALEAGEKVVMEVYQRLVEKYGEVEVSPRLREVREFVEALCYREEKTIGVICHDPPRLEIRSLDLNVKALTEDFDYVIAMSGTLPPKKYVINVWQIPKNELWYIDLSWYKMGKFRVYIHTSLTTRFKERQRDLPTLCLRYATMLREIYEQAKKHVLAVFPAYDLMYAILNRLVEHAPEIEDKLIVESPNIKFGDVNKMLDRIGKALICAVAGGKLTEGIEFRRVVKDRNGNVKVVSLLSDIVIVGVPYRPPTPYNQELEETIRRRSGLSLQYIRDVKAWILVRQAIGRAVRSPEDSVNVWLLDYRFNMDFWRENLVRKLVDDEKKIVYITASTMLA